MVWLRKIGLNVQRSHSTVHDIIKHFKTFTSIKIILSHVSVLCDHGSLYKDNFTKVVYIQKKSQSITNNGNLIILIVKSVIDFLSTVFYNLYSYIWTLEKDCSNSYFFNRGDIAKTILIFSRYELVNSH